MKLHLFKPLAKYGVQKPKDSSCRLLCVMQPNSLLINSHVDQPTIQASLVFLGNSYATLTEGYSTLLTYLIQRFCGLVESKIKIGLTFRQIMRGFKGESG